MDRHASDGQSPRHWARVGRTSGTWQHHRRSRHALDGDILGSDPLAAYDAAFSRAAAAFGRPGALEIHWSERDGRAANGILALRTHRAQSPRRDTYGRSSQPCGEYCHFWRRLAAVSAASAASGASNAISVDRCILPADAAQLIWSFGREDRVGGGSARSSSTLFKTRQTASSQFSVCVCRDPGAAQGHATTSDTTEAAPDGVEHSSMGVC
jgi:hypothetical protein